MSGGLAKILVLLLAWSSFVSSAPQSYFCCSKCSDGLLNSVDYRSESVGDGLYGECTCGDDDIDALLSCRCLTNPRAEAVCESESLRPERLTEESTHMGSRRYLSALPETLMPGNNTSSRTSPMEPLLQSCSFLS